jgi:hypothetical protein
MWLGIGYLLPMKGDKAGDPTPPIASNFIISQSGIILLTEDDQNEMVRQTA